MPFFADTGLVVSATFNCNALDASKYTFSHSHPAYLSEHGRLAHYSGGATYPVTAQVNAIKFMPQNGNFTTAQGISLYGLKEY